MISGFRASIGGAQKYYGIEPDLTTLGKIIGGGLPAAAFGGSKKYMDQLSPEGPIYQAGTLSGNPMAMTAGYWVLRQLEAEGFYESLEKKTLSFLEPIERAMQNKWPQRACIQRVGSMFTFFFGRGQVKDMADATACDNSTFWSFFNYLLERGVYISPSPYETCCLMQAHTQEHLKKAQSIILDFIEAQ